MADLKSGKECEPNTPCPDNCTEMGFSDAVTKTLADAKVDVNLLWTAVKSTGADAVTALEGIFAKLTGKTK